MQITLEMRKMLTLKLSETKVMSIIPLFIAIAVFTRDATRDFEKGWRRRPRGRRRRRREKKKRRRERRRLLQVCSPFNCLSSDILYVLWSVIIKKKIYLIQKSLYSAQLKCYKLIGPNLKNQGYMKEVDWLVKTLRIKEINFAEIKAVIKFWENRIFKFKISFISVRN